MSLENALKKYQQRVNTLPSQQKANKKSSPTLSSFGDFDFEDFTEDFIPELSENSFSENKNVVLDNHSRQLELNKDIIITNTSPNLSGIADDKKCGNIEEYSTDIANKDCVDIPNEFDNKQIPTENKNSNDFSTSFESPKAFLNNNIIDELGEDFDLGDFDEILGDSISTINDTPDNDVYDHAAQRRKELHLDESNPNKSSQVSTPGIHNSLSPQKLIPSKKNDLKHNQLNVFITPNNKIYKKQQNQEPSAKNLHKQQTVTSIIKSVNRSMLSNDRGLPGPAGSLGIQAALHAEKDNNISKYGSDTGSKDSLSQSISKFTDQDFDSIAWTTLLSEYNIDEYKPSTLLHLQRDSIYLEWDIQRINKIDQPRLIPYLLALVSEYCSTESDASATLIDPTGEISASIHHGFFKVKGNHIAIGSAILLKNAAVMKSRDNQCYLVMTANTTEKVFTPNYVHEEYKKPPIYISESQIE
ncbi:hypothetical protein BB561_002028 [Smittium simulii]|uniref:Homologous recombination OB-fold protein OB-fold domain-containing protein n=1 Tax=Smittium simulii TaxID=133385 RepID=A0A2T9YS87_9FUNG|nr:hypothetical protein BB561_002028 [Smittium simulii]